ncbi:hypothetical protein V2J09_000320 [Rumex salicifolius]
MESSLTEADQTTAPAPKPPHIVIFPSPGIGHLIPLIEFAKRLVPRFSFTLAVPTAGPPSSAERSLLSSLPPGVDSVFLPPIQVSDTENPMLVIVPRSLPSLRQLITADRRRVAALVVDLFGTDAIDVAMELGVSPYIFYPSTAMALSLFLHLEKLDETVSSHYYEMTEPIRILGCVPVNGRDLVDVFEDRTSDAYKWILRHCKRYKLAEGIIVNSFDGVEGGAIRELLKPKPGKPPVYPVGPLVQSSSAGHECLKWLDEQPRGSVLLVNFGSGGTLTSEQTKELAHGLALSQQRFLWVIRSPNDAVSNGAYFGVDGAADPHGILPEGFLDETAGRGLVVPKWAPQIQVLSHVSTGGFLTHCGWNSVLESVVNGVPMITWPLYAEQKMNAVMLSEDLRVGVRPKLGPDGVVRRDEVSRVVRELMAAGEEGKRMRSRMEELKAEALAAMSPDHGV